MLSATILLFYLIILLCISVFFLKQNSTIIKIFLYPWIFSIVSFLLIYLYIPSYDFFKLLKIDNVELSAVYYLIILNTVFLGSILCGVNVKILPEKKSIKNYSPNSLYYLFLVILIIAFIFDFTTNIQSYFSPLSVYELRISDDVSSRLSQNIYFYFSLICFPVSIFLIFKNGFSFLRLIPVILLFIAAISNLSKFIILFMVSYCICMFFLKQDNFFPKREQIRKIGLRFLVIVFISFIFITSFRTTNNKDEDKPVLVIFHAYLGGYLPSFSTYFVEYSNKFLSTEPSYENYDKAKSRFGNQTFAGFYRIMNQLGFADFGSTVHYSGLFNVYSFWRDLIQDFGLYGTGLFTSFLGFIIGILHRNLNKFSFTGLNILTLIGVYMSFTLFYSITGFSFFYFVLIFPSFLLKKIHK
ncbi:MAG: O-antigen polymerase [Bacteroidota bacterium]